MVTVVDALNFLKDYSTADFLQDRGQSLGEDDQRTVVDLLIDQVEFCDVIVVNKGDLVTMNDMARLVSILHTLNPRAEILVSRFGAVPLDKVFNTGKFSFQAASAAPGWLQEMRGEHVPETEEYGIASFAYRQRRPFHPQRFWELIHAEWEGVLRSKGYFWLASRMEFAGSWSQAGGACRHGAAGLWWSAVDEADWPEEAESRTRIKAKMAGDFGDRRQELVFIGIGMDEAAITARLDACLLTDAELARGELEWVKWPDPFPVWGAIEEEE